MKNATSGASYQFADAGGGAVPLGAWLAGEPDDLRRGGGVIVLGGVYSGRPPPAGGAFRGPIDAQSGVARSGVRDPGCFPDHDEEV
jgi:hypothetical protein